MDNTCKESGCNYVAIAKGKCVICSIIGEGEELKTRERPSDRPMALLHHTKKMYQSNTNVRR